MFTIETWASRICSDTISVQCSGKGICGVDVTHDRVGDLEEPKGTLEEPEGTVTDEAEVTEPLSENKRTQCSWQ